MRLRHTPFYDQHRKDHAKMGEFAGYDMPLYYKLGVIKEHLWTRSHAGLFDVSHMGQVDLKGLGITDFLHKITPSSFANLEPMQAKYTLLTNPEGGIIDDLIITKIENDHFRLVLNAGRKAEDITWIQSHLPAEITLEHYDDMALLALQGPEAEKVLAETLYYDLSDLPYMESAHDDQMGLLISRLGYTGEDGFELTLPEAEAPALWDKLRAHPDVRPIGLAARDSLRLEMGYPLYGHDIDETTSPLEAGLGWVMARDHKDFIGAGPIAEHKKNGPPRRRVGIILRGKGVAREGAEIRTAEDQIIGHLTSGGFSPTLKKSIGQGYVEAAYAKIDHPVFIHIRGRNIEATIAPVAFLRPKTKRAPE